MPATPAVSAKPTRILALCDSIVPRPGAALTGFGRVSLNLFTRWNVPVDVWSIGFEGHGYKVLADSHPNITLIPAGNQDWNSVPRLTAFLKQLSSGNYTHVFILMDPDAVSANEFPRELKRLCREKKIQSVIYYPVDAPLLPPCGIIDAVDTAITFTEYGAQETRKALGRSLFPVAVIPHGIDPHFTPVTPAEREKYRNEFQVVDASYKVAADGVPKMKPFLKPGDFLILNVNKNEWRKDPLRSLEILKGLRDAGVPAKLVMRMSPTSFAGGVHLERAAEQMGLKLDEHWAHIGPVPEEHLRGLYGAADLYLTTSLGEGWGLGVTEALACGTPVALPSHTSLYEIGHRVLRAHHHFPAVRFLELETGFVCGYDTRLRSRVDLTAAVESIGDYFANTNLYPRFRVELPPEIRDWLSWDRVADSFLDLMGIEGGAA